MKKCPFDKKDCILYECAIYVIEICEGERCGTCGEIAILDGSVSYERPIINNEGVV